MKQLEEHTTEAERGRLFVISRITKNIGYRARQIDDSKERRGKIKQDKARG